MRAIIFALIALMLGCLIYLLGNQHEMITAISKENHCDEKCKLILLQEKFEQMGF